jgi:hypothetical protein
MIERILAWTLPENPVVAPRIVGLQQETLVVEALRRAVCAIQCIDYADTQSFYEREARPGGEENRGE